MLRVKLLGAGEATYNHTPLAGFPNRKSSSLLSYLLLNRHYPLQREQLAAIFWADYSTQKSRKYLRHALWRLRQTLSEAGTSPDEYLLVSDESIAFVQRSRYWLDVEVFEESAKRCDDVPAESLDAAQAERLEAAVALYSGDLLEGIYEDWCLYDRERLNLLYLHTLKKLTSYHEYNGTYERGLTFGARMLAHDRTLERVHRQMMRLYWLAGDRNAALAQYKRCEQILREELDMPPMEETKRLYDQMLHNQYVANAGGREESISGEAGQSERSPRARKRVLQEVQQLRAKVDEARADLQRLERLLNTIFSGRKS